MRKLLKALAFAGILPLAACGSSLPNVPPEIKQVVKASLDSQWLECDGLRYTVMNNSMYRFSVSYSTPSVAFSAWDKSQGVEAKYEVLASYSNIQQHNRVNGQWVWQDTVGNPFFAHVTYLYKRGASWNVGDTLTMSKDLSQVKPRPNVCEKLAR